MRTIAEVKSFLEADARISEYVRLFVEDRPQVESEPDASSVANALVQSWGYEAINPRSWRGMGRIYAEKIATRLLSEDLAYKSELLRNKTAAHVSACMMRTLCPYEAQFFCNADFHGTAVSWDPIGTGTFEVALIGFDTQRAFMLYAQAED